MNEWMTPLTWLAGLINNVDIIMAAPMKIEMTWMMFTETYGPTKRLPLINEGRLAVITTVFLTVNCDDNIG